MNTKKIKILAPATIANLVCGFDILGMAITEPQDEMWMQLNNTGQINITHTDAYNLPTEPTKNVAGAALIALQKYIENKNIGFDVTINKIIKPGSGLGSSAASAAGAIAGANYLLGNILSKQEQVHFATFGEEVASGARHADNIAPCIYGGVTLIRSMQPLDIIAIAPPPLFVTVIHPQIEIKTSEARKLLPTEIPLKNAVTQWGNVAALIASLLQGNYELLSRSLTDVVAEPVRSTLIPGFAQVKAQSLTAGALGGGISGSGPSIFMLSQTNEIALHVEQAMIAVYKNLNIAFNTYVTTVNNNGVKITEE
jgi:homoserine kinase